MAQQPGEGQFQEGVAAFAGPGLQGLDPVEGGVTQGGLSSGPPGGEPGALRRGLAAPVLARQQARGQREERQEAQAEVVAGRQHLAFHVALQQRIEVLGRDEAGLAGRAPVGVGDLPAAVVGVAEVADLALGDQVVQRPQGLVYRGVGVRLMVLVEVDVVGVQAAQAVFDRLQNPLARPAALFGVLADLHPEFGGQHDFMAALAQRLAEEFLRLRPAIDVGGVEQGDPGVEGGVHHGLGLGLIDAHAEVVAAQPHDADLQPRIPQPTDLHSGVLHVCDWRGT